MSYQCYHREMPFDSEDPDKAVPNVKTLQYRITNSEDSDSAFCIYAPAFNICKNKDADQLCSNRTAVTAQLISAFVLAT